MLFWKGTSAPPLPSFSKGRGAIPRPPAFLALPTLSATKFARLNAKSVSGHGRPATNDDATGKRKQRSASGIRRFAEELQRPDSARIVQSARSFVTCSLFLIMSSSVAELVLRLAKCSFFRSEPFRCPSFYLRLCPFLLHNAPRSSPCAVFAESSLRCFCRVIHALFLQSHATSTVLSV